MKKLEVELPKGCWFQCARVENGKVVIELNEITKPQFQSLEKSEPSTWEEFCKTTPVVKGEAFICEDSEIEPCFEDTERGGLFAIGTFCQTKKPRKPFLPLSNSFNCATGITTVGIPTTTPKRCFTS